VKRIYLRNCKVHVEIENRGKGGVTPVDYQKGKLQVKVLWKLPKAGGKTFLFSLAKVDPNGRLKNPGGKVSFDTEISLGAAKIYHVTGELLHLKNDIKQKGKKEAFQDLILPVSCLSRPRKPGSRKVPAKEFPRPLVLEKPATRLPQFRREVRGRPMG